MQLLVGGGGRWKIRPKVKCWKNGREIGICFMRAEDSEVIADISAALKEIRTPLSN